MLNDILLYSCICNKILLTIITLIEHRNLKDHYVYVQLNRLCRVKTQNGGKENWTPITKAECSLLSGLCKYII